MTDMIERVAKALYEITTNNAVGWECENQTFWWKQARAAITHAAHL